jgi:hypothetical protein
LTVLPIDFFCETQGKIGTTGTRPLRLRFPGEIPKRELHQPKEAVRQHKAAIGA